MASFLPVVMFFVIDHNMKNLSHMERLKFYF